MEGVMEEAVGIEEHGVLLQSPKDGEVTGGVVRRSIPRLAGGFLMVGALAFVSMYYFGAADPSTTTSEAGMMDVHTFNQLPGDDRLAAILKVAEHHVPVPDPGDKHFRIAKVRDGPKRGWDYWSRQLDEHVRKLQTQTISPVRGLEIAQCSFDCYQIVVTVGQIVVSIDGLKEACSAPYPDTFEKRTTCAGLVMLQIGFYGFIYTYITDAVSNCPGKFNLHAGCALNVGGLVTSAIKVGGAGAQMAGNCNQGLGGPEDEAVDPDAFNAKARKHIKPETLEKIKDLFRSRVEERPELGYAWALGGGRRLEVHNASDPWVREWNMSESRRLEKLPPDPLMQQAANPSVRDLDDNEDDSKDDQHKKQWAVAACTMDTQNLVLKMAVVGNSIGFSTFDCTAENFRKRGHPGENKCAIDIGLIVGNLGIAGVMVTLDIINCPATLEYNPDALCAGAISDVIGQAGFLATTWAGMQDTCGTLSAEKLKEA
eukprot:TRINITY_DN10430_c0_g1_i3.p1 TRINITY_DN10430_c0_g1~~TRINITY_DN10430_c0_g1_i3.p1  ORF type:complete len:513 (+),score=101.33 TRINITY_DN10430_c0_g1_i3:88-1539(+)